MTARQHLKQVLTPVALVLAIAYFLIDALFLSMIRPIASRLARLPIFAGLTAWVRSLGPYSTLALFLVPVLLLEPVKPIGAYLIGTRHVIGGTLLIMLGEVLKIVIVERIFHLGRDKLMSIRTFAHCYRFVTRWLAYLRAFPAWQAAERRMRRVRALSRRIVRDVCELIGNSPKA
jgi:hypothetical protein